MKTSAHILFIFLFLHALGTKAQMCEQMKLLNEGATYTITSYDARDKKTGMSQNRVISSNRTGEAIEAVISNESFDHKGKSLGSGEVAMKCENNILNIDLRSMMNPQSMKGFENMEIQVEDNLLEIPSALSPGASLKDGLLKMYITSEGQKIATIELKILNRKVEKMEKVTTSAGTFDAWKITYETEMVTTAIIPLRVITTNIDWFVPGFGTVRTESYNRQGKLQGYSVITETNMLGTE